MNYDRGIWYDDITNRPLSDSGGFIPLALLVYPCRFFEELNNCKFAPFLQKML